MAQARPSSGEHNNEAYLNTDDNVAFSIRKLEIKDSNHIVRQKNLRGQLTVGLLWISSSENTGKKKSVKGSSVLMKNIEKPNRDE